MSPFLIIIVLLVSIVIGLILYNLSIHNKIKTFNNINDRINSLNVLQEFLDVVGKDSSVDDKLEIINNILIEKFEIKYSTIVVFDGAEYVIKATNVSDTHWDMLKNLHTDEMFRDSIESATPKYVTVNKPEEKLSYQKTEKSRAKSAMFFPLYIDNIYIGYWIIENAEPHAYDNRDTNILGIVKENIISVLKTVSYQNTIENIYRVDKFTGLNSGEYLYGKAKRVIDQYPESTICMFRIMNIEKINEIFGRDEGTQLLIDLTNIIKRNISAEYVFVRYMGPKFVIAFSGIDFDGVELFVTSIKEEIEKLKVVKEEKIAGKGKKRKLMMHPKMNFVLATYYKGTGLEEVTKRLEEYLDDCDKNESNINFI